MKFIKLLKQEKSHIISLFIMPIMAALLLGLCAGNPFVENIPFGVVDNDNSTLSRTIVKQLKIHPGLNVNYYADSEAELEQAIKEKKVNGGIVVPKDFGKDVSLMKSPRVLLLADNTNMMIGGNASAYSSTVLGTLNAGGQISVFEGKNMLPSVAKKNISSFSYVERVLYDPQSSYIRNLVYTVIPFAAQLAFVTQFLVPFLIEKKKEFYSIKIRSKEGVGAVFDILARILLLSTVSIISTFIALCMVGKLFGVPLRGDILIYIALMYLLFINLTAIGLVFAAIIDNVGYFLLFYNMINLIILLTAGISYPQFMMPSGLVKAVKCIWPFVHAAVPLKYLNLKGVGLEVILPYIKEGLLYTSFWLPAGIALYSARIALRKHKNKTLLNKKEDINEKLLDTEEKLTFQLN